MSKLKYYLKSFKEHQKNIEAVIIVLVIAAVLVFGPKGENDKAMQGNQKEITTQEKTETTSEKPVQEKVAQEEFYADISGCVKSPGIYKIKKGARLFEVIELAGGLTEDADYNGFNQAEKIEDGDKIIIPSKEFSDESGENIGTVTSGKINLNTADVNKLQEIPGIGPSTAEKIISYRQNNGRFHKIEDLMNISGIGEKTFEKMEDKITV